MRVFKFISRSKNSLKFVIQLQGLEGANKNINSISNNKIYNWELNRVQSTKND